MHRVYTETKWVDSTGCTQFTLGIKTFWFWKDIYFHAREVCYEDLDKSKKNLKVTVTAIKWWTSKYNNIWHFRNDNHWTKDGR